MFYTFFSISTTSIYRFIGSNAVNGYGYSKVDNIKCQLDRLKRKLKLEGIEIKMSYYMLRKLPPSLMVSKGKGRFDNMYSLWLGHAPKDVADIHYIVYDETYLDDSIGWLHDEIIASKTDDIVPEIDEPLVDEGDEAVGQARK